MLPTLAPGDRLLVDYRRTPLVGDVVVARIPDGTLVVKRVAAPASFRGVTSWYLLGDNPDLDGTGDSRGQGAIADTAVLGVVRRRIWPRPAHLSRRV